MQAKKKSKRLSPGLVGRAYEPDEPLPPTEPPESSPEPPAEPAEQSPEEVVAPATNTETTGVDVLLYEAPRPPILTLKSVAHPVIPSTNPDAPYGFDENDRPIGMPVGKPYVRPEQTGIVERPSGPCRCGKLLCRHCHPEFAAQTEVLKVTPQPSGLDALVMDALAAKFGPIKPVEPSRFIFFPEVLGITRRQILALMDMAVAYEPRAVRKRVLKNRATVEKQIGELETLNAKVVELKAKIQEAEEIIHGLSARVMKLRRDKENILDKNTREQFKREERKKIGDATQELQTVRRSIRSLPELNAQKERLANWGKSDDDYENVSVTKIGPVPFGEKFALSKELERAGQTIESYTKFMRDLAVMDSSWRFHLPGVDDWRYLENEIVRQAIQWKLLRPSRATIEKYPELIGSWTEEDYAQDDTENALILKTGGGLIGASIYNFGKNRSGSTRLSGSFDGATEHANKDGRGGPASESSDSFFSDMDSGDFSYENS